MTMLARRVRHALACSSLALALSACQAPAPVGPGVPASAPAASHAFALLGDGADAGLLGPTQPIAVAENRERIDPVSAFNLQDDGFMAVWVESEYDDHAVVGQRLDADGRPLGEEFVIRRGAGWSPQIVYNHLTNEFLVTWQEATGTLTDDPAALVAQRVAADGRLRGTAREVLRAPRIEGLKAAYDIKHNDYLLVYNTAGRVMGQRVGVAAQPLGAPLSLSLGAAAGPTVDVTYNVRQDQYMVVWDEAHGGPHAVWGRLVDGDGALHPTASMLSGSGFNASAAVAYDYNDDRYMATWSSDGDVVAQRVSKDNLVVGPPVTVCAAPEPQTEPTIAYNHLLDQFLISWTDQRDPLVLDVDPRYPNPDVYAQQVAADGTLVGGNVAIAASADRREARPSVTSHCRSRGYLVLWNQLNAGGPFGVGPFNIYGRRVGE